MSSLAQIIARQRVLASAGIKLAYDVVDVRDVERTPAWMHAHNALIDKITGQAPDNPLYHPAFAQLDEQTLLSMIPPREVRIIEEFYPQVAELQRPKGPPVQPVPNTPTMTRPMIQAGEEQPGTETL